MLRRSYSAGVVTAVFLLLISSLAVAAADDGAGSTRLRGGGGGGGGVGGQQSPASSTSSSSAISTNVESSSSSSSSSSTASVNRRFRASYYPDWKGRRLIHSCATMIADDDDNTDYTIFEANEICFNMLLQSTDLASVEEDHAIFAFSSQEDPFRTTAFASSSPLHRNLAETVPWGVQAIQADLLEPGPHNVTICVVDTGVAADHPDLQTDRISGQDRSDGNRRWKWNVDRAGHGTHVAGTIAAVANNEKGVIGVGSSGGGSGQTLHLFAVRALGDDGSGFESDIWMALQQCIQDGADVVNLSLGSTIQSEFARELYEEAVETHGMVLVAAAGNSGDATQYFPAFHPSVISVGATTEAGDRVFNSVVNDQIELMAPGLNILSTSTAQYSLQTSTFGYPAERIVGTPDVAVTGPLALCEYEKGKCNDVEEGGICLYGASNEDMANENTSMRQVLQGCKESGGVGAVFFNPDRGNIERLYIQGGGIPAIAIDRGSGSALMIELDEAGDEFQYVTIGDQGGDQVEFTYTLKSGTSMAAPHVAASVGLLKSHFYDCKPSQLRFVLSLTASHPTEKKRGRCDREFGYGIVQVKDAYDWLVDMGGCNGWDAPVSASFGGCKDLDENNVVVLEEEDEDDAINDEVDDDGNPDWLIDIFNTMANDAPDASDVANEGG